MTNQPQEQEDTLDTLVRDLTTVHPMPKSEVRRRLSDFIECAKAEERQFILNVLDGIDIADAQMGVTGGTKTIRHALQARHTGQS